MKARDFCFWLQGFFELTKPTGTNSQTLDAFQVDLIRRHLALVFQHDIDVQIEQEKPGLKPLLDAIHDTTRPTMRC